MASKRITQETFDAAVRENIQEFEMGPEEAVREAVEQFESQGVDLSNIVKMTPKVSADGPQDPIHDILQALDDLQESLALSRPQEVSAHLTRFCEQCKEQKACRFLAAEKGAYSILLETWKLAAAGDRGLLLQALNALSALTDGQPDLLDTQGLQLLVATLAHNAESAHVTCSGIRCVRLACLKHERNRQSLVKAGVLPLLTGAIARHSRCADVVREACWALRVMTFDDDIRVPFGHAHDHAKMIVQENGGLKVLIEAAKVFPDNPSILSELCSTLSRLAVRNEFCQEVVDLGGLSVLVALLADCNDHQELVKQVLSALRAIAGNDDVKDAIVRAGGTESIVAAMTRHLASPQVCEQSCAALCVLALRKPANSRVIMEGGGAQAALQAMKAHPQEAGVQVGMGNRRRGREPGGQVGQEARQQVLGRAERRVQALFDLAHHHRDPSLQGLLPSRLQCPASPSQPPKMCLTLPAVVLSPVPLVFLHLILPFPNSLFRGILVGGSWVDPQMGLCWDSWKLPGPTLGCCFGGQSS